ncbi:MAG: M1 family metallopeptidase [Candidatus Marinimicrobia bacterium]|nr:M1 family metallopeptidase [Candidatus Neomarinimicrobiota bacterium]
MKKTFIRLVFSIFLMVSSLLGNYWQQWVEYEMDVFLDAEAKTLTASSSLIYVNNSPDTLDQMLMHLYHNAFNEGTIAHEVWNRYGQTNDLEKGWTGIQIQSARVDSLDLDFKIRDDTILDIELNQALAPGDTLKMSLKWQSIIHPFLDRSGWKAQQFDFAQWYPKFVVYDQNGWHDDPFGDWGEFYGEIGNYRVHLDIPLGQIVCATGVPIEGDPGWNEVSVDTSLAWLEWVEDFRKNRAEYLAELDSSARRQVSFYAENVHDFAWLCSQDFVYEHGKWNEIDINVLFTTQVGEAWSKKVVKHSISAVKWLSEKFGTYPWPQMTVTKGLLSGGMEYPMLVMDETDSESLIVHEIGHNWFYGIFGNDELDEAWLDEGFTSFATIWYLEEIYPDNGFRLTRDYITKFEADHLPQQMYLERDLKPVIRYMLSPRHEPIAKHSFDFNNYGSYTANVYDKASLMMYSLKAYLGDERFLNGMRLYFDRWALKHVNEDRFIKAMEDGSGMELDWFFDQWLHATNYVDYKLADWDVEQIDPDHFTTHINVENRGGMFVPISATVYGKAGESLTASLKEFKFRSAGTIEVDSDFQPQRVYLDAENVFLDVDRRDNDSQRKHAWRYDYKDWDEFPDDRNLYLWKPRFGISDSAGLGIGVNVKRVYRNSGNFVAIALDENLKSGDPDISISFNHILAGPHIQAKWFGSAGSWRSLTYGNLNYELHWARKLWANPVHYLTLKLEETDADLADLPLSSRNSFMRFGVKYELQDDLLDGKYGFSAIAHFSPAGLGTYGQDFVQLSVMSNWTRIFDFFKINNRSNLIANGKSTPDIVQSRIASSDLRSTYLNRTASSLHNMSSADLLGPRYYLVGGGRMRGYSDSLDVPVNFIWSNNLDITLGNIPHTSDELDFGLFLDLGQYSDDGQIWEWLGDMGVGFVYKPSWKRNSWLTTLIRPLKIKLEFPVTRYENGVWVNTLASQPWIFSISN